MNLLAQNDCAMDITGDKSGLSFRGTPNSVLFSYFLPVGQITVGLQAYMINRVLSGMSVGTKEKFLI